MGRKGEKVKGLTKPWALAAWPRRVCPLCVRRVD